MLYQCTACGTHVDESRSCPRCNGSKASGPRTALLVAALGVTFAGSSCDRIQDLIPGPQAVYGPPPMEDVPSMPPADAGSGEASVEEPAAAAEGSGEPEAEGSAAAPKEEPPAAEPEPKL